MNKFSQSVGRSTQLNSDNIISSPSNQRTADQGQPTINHSVDLPSNQRTADLRPPTINHSVDLPSNQRTAGQGQPTINHSVDLPSNQRTADQGQLTINHSVDLPSNQRTADQEQPTINLSVDLPSKQRTADQGQPTINHSEDLPSNQRTANQGQPTINHSEDLPSNQRTADQGQPTINHSVDLPSNQRTADLRPPTSYTFPPEWAKHEATWLTWPHKEESWPGKIDAIYPKYAEFIKYLSLSEKVRINVRNDEMKQFALKHIETAGADLSKIEFYFNPSNDAWCRDHGPAFLINTEAEQKKVIVDWNFNAWGGKYPPFDLDDVIPTKIGAHFNIPVFHPGIIMEGGSVEFNGAGTILTSKSCLLNENRNPHLNQEQIEQYLKDFYGQQQILWVSDGIVGDDTDGHIDDTVRFVNHNTVLTVVEDDQKDENYELLQTNLKELKAMRLLNGEALNIIELPMPDAVIYEDTRLPASYANFYISNAHVIVPTYNCAKDKIALEIIAKCFPTRETVGIDSTDIIWGLGSFHCLSQQEPAV